METSEIRDPISAVVPPPLTDVTDLSIPMTQKGSRIGSQCLRLCEKQTLGLCSTSQTNQVLNACQSS